jgi:hypothetical protein
MSHKVRVANGNGCGEREIVNAVLGLVVAVQSVMDEKENCLTVATPSSLLDGKRYAKWQEMTH